MSLRGFGYQTLTGSAQPVFGTTVTAAVKPMPDMQTGLLTPASAPSQSIVGIAANMFRKGDHVMIGAPASLEQGSTVNPDGGAVTAISTAANTITVSGLMRAHAAGEAVVLAMPCAQINIQNGSSPTLYLGEDPTVGSDSSTLVETCSAQGGIVIGAPALGNLIESQHLWIKGTASNTFLPYLLTI